MEIPEEVYKLLDNANFSLPGEIIRIPASENGIFIPIDAQRDSGGRQQPSKGVLNLVRAQLGKLGFDAEFLLVNEQSIAAEESLRSSLGVKFGALVETAYLSVERAVSNVWLTTQTQLKAHELDEIVSHSNQICELFNLPAPRVITLSSLNLPTKLEILRVIRRLSPVNCESLKTALEERNYAVPSLDWINKQFDLLRKNRMIIRTQDRKYALTAEALNKMGTIKGRSSPDIDRLLALARGQT